MLCVLYVPPEYASEGLVKKVVTKVTSDNEQKVTAGVRFVLRTTPHHFSFPVPSLHLSLY